MQAGMNGDRHLVVATTVTEEYCTRLLQMFHKVDFSKLEAL
jgi:hypothetical protein